MWVGVLFSLIITSHIVLVQLIKWKACLINVRKWSIICFLSCLGCILFFSMLTHYGCYSYFWRELTSLLEFSQLLPNTFLTGVELFVEWHFSQTGANIIVKILTFSYWIFSFSLFTSFKVSWSDFSLFYSTLMVAIAFLLMSAIACKL